MSFPLNAPRPRHIDLNAGEGWTTRTAYFTNHIPIIAALPRKRDEEIISRTIPRSGATLNFRMSVPDTNE